MPVTEKRFQTRMPYHVHDKLVHASELLGEFSLLLKKLSQYWNKSEC